jgi:N-acetylglutamate synthase-like GNAT family acetyltransferase
MKIIDLSEYPKHNHDYFVCLEEWFDPFEESIQHKEKWYEKMQKTGKGLRVKLALDENGVVGGMIHYMPIENSFIEGEDLYFIPCIWVHRRTVGRGNMQGHGMGVEMLKAAEEDVRSLGAKGIVAWGMSWAGWMEGAWFVKHGYQEVDRNGVSVLVWKPFTDDAKPPKWILPRKNPATTPGKVTVTTFMNGWCPVYNMLHDWAKKASGEFGDKVIFQTIDTFDKDTIEEWGVVDGVYVDGENIQKGAPPSYEEIKEAILEKVKGL